MTQDEEVFDCSGGFFDDAKDVMWRCVIKLVHQVCGLGTLEGGGCEFPGFLRSRRRGGQHVVGYQSVGGHIGADLRGILSSALDQPARTVFHARFGAFCLGVTN